MSPACSITLLVGSPLSIKSFRLTVMVLDKVGGSGTEGRPGPGKTSFCPALVTGGLLSAGPFTAGPTGCVGLRVVLSTGGGALSPLAGMMSSLLIAGASATLSWSASGRVTITESPASADTPPASANTSSSVTGWSAWYTMGWGTAPTTVIGLL